MDLTLKTYLAYLLVSLGLTAWVAHTLFRNGRRFLVDVFAGDEGLADSVNHLLVVGFYLVNLGYVTLAMRTRAPLATPREAVETLSYKLGTVLVVLGLLHFGNLYVFTCLRRRSAAGGRGPDGPRSPDGPGRRDEPRSRDEPQPDDGPEAPDDRPRTSPPPWPVRPVEGGAPPATEAAS